MGLGLGLGLRSGFRHRAAEEEHIEEGGGVVEAERAEEVLVERLALQLVLVLGLGLGLGLGLKLGLGLGLG